MTADDSSKPFELDQDSALERVSESTWRGALTDRWSIGGVPNGGYSMLVAAKGLREALGFPHPLSFTGYYVQPVTAGSIELAVEVMRRGQTQASGMVRMLQEGRERARFLGTFCDLATRSGLTEVGAPLGLPDPEDCPPLPQAQFGWPPIIERFDYRMPQDAPAFWRGLPQPAEVRGWIRFRDGRPVDAISLLLIADAFFPAIFNRVGPVGWVPTLEMTVFVRGLPTGTERWLACRFVNRHITSGYLEEDGEVWDEAGNLLAIVRQLARLRLARGGER